MRDFSLLKIIALEVTYGVDVQINNHAGERESYIEDIVRGGIF